MRAAGGAARPVAYAQVARAAGRLGPAFDPRTWDFRVFGLVDSRCDFPGRSSPAFLKSEVLADMHCVTRWSRFDNRWGGVLATDLMRQREAAARSEARHDSCRAGLHREPAARGFPAPNDNFCLAPRWRAARCRPRLPAAPGGAHLYAWKSVKWVRGIEFLERELPGFWEKNGYHIYGDPFKEQRYSS